MSPDELGEVLGQMADALPEVESLFDMTVLSPQQAIGLTDQARELLATRNLQLLRSATELQEREKEFKKQANRLDYIARQDALTGIYNRRHFDEAFAERFAHAVTGGHELSLAYLDLDHFKTINDEHGHPVGDEILTRVAAEIQTQLRQDDLFARYGGEEFVLLLPAIGPEAAEKILGRIRAAVENLHHHLPSGRNLKVTLSAGVASYPRGPRKYESPEILMQAADQALYQAKQSGRNSVVSAV
jgi:diguanylate cyclase (GGDEF)-like protein